MEERIKNKFVMVVVNLLHFIGGIVIAFGLMVLILIVTSKDVKQAMALVMLEATPTLANFTIVYENGALGFKSQSGKEPFITSNNIICGSNAEYTMKETDGIITFCGQKPKPPKQRAPPVEMPLSLEWVR